MAGTFELKLLAAFPSFGNWSRFSDTHPYVEVIRTNEAPTHLGSPQSISGMHPATACTLMEHVGAVLYKMSLEQKGLGFL